MKEILLYDLTSLLTSVSIILKNEIVENSSAFLLLGVTMAFFTDFDFGGVVKRFIQAFIAISIYGTLFVGSSDAGFSVANKIISSKNYVVGEMENSLKLARDGTSRNGSKNENKSVLKKVIDAISNLPVTFIDDPVDLFIYTLANLSLWFVKITFTLCFYLPQMLIFIVAFINVLPVTNKSLSGGLITIVWIFITPIVIAIILEIIHAIMTGQGMNENIGFIPRAMMGITTSLYLIASFTISYALLRGDGLATAISSTSQSYGAGMVSGATNYVMRSARNMGSRFFYRKGANSIREGLREAPFSKMVINPPKDSFMKKRNQVVAKRVEATKPQISPDGNIVIPPTPKLSNKEKAIIGTNAILNPIKTISSRRDAKRKNTGSIIAQNEHGKSNKINNTNSSPSDVPNLVKTKSSDFENNTYVHDRKFWNKIDENHKNAIQKKYGIPYGEKPKKGVKYYPVADNTKKENSIKANLINENRKS